MAWLYNRFALGGRSSPRLMHGLQGEARAFDSKILAGQARLNRVSSGLSRRPAAGNDPMFYGIPREVGARVQIQFAG